jgi:hypothetical protein
MDWSHQRYPTGKCVRSHTIHHIHKWSPRGIRKHDQTFRRWCQRFASVKVNSMWPNTLPCGIPLVTSVHDELWPFNTTLCCFSCKKSSIQSSRFPLIPTWLLKFNKSKCKHMHLGPETDYNYMMEENMIVNTMEEKDLLNSCRNMSLSMYLNDILISPSFWFALLTCLLIWFWKFSLLSNILVLAID